MKHNITAVDAEQHDGQKSYKRIFKNGNTWNSPSLAPPTSWWPAPDSSPHASHLTALNLALILFLTWRIRKFRGLTTKDMFWCLRGQIFNCALKSLKMCPCFCENAKYLLFWSCPPCSLSHVAGSSVALKCCLYQSVALKPAACRQQGWAFIRNSTFYFSQHTPPR